MTLSRDSKITRFKIEKIEVKIRKEQRESRIKFSINNTEFTTEKPFPSEKEFYEKLISGEHVICKHVFPADVVDAELKRTYNVWIEGEYAVIFFMI